MCAYRTGLVIGARHIGQTRLSIAPTHSTHMYLRCKMGNSKHRFEHIAAREGEIGFLLCGCERHDSDFGLALYARAPEIRYTIASSFVAKSLQLSKRLWEQCISAAARSRSQSDGTKARKPPPSASGVYMYLLSVRHIVSEIVTTLLRKADQSIF